MVAVTEFQVHISQQEEFENCASAVFDYTEQRLMRYVKLISDRQQKQALNDLLEKYRKGRVAICWKGGNPSWLDLDI